MKFGHKLELPTLVLDNLPNAVVVTDLDNRIIYVNKALEQYTGYAGHELIGRSPAVLNNERNAALVEDDICKTIKSGRSWTGELLQKCKDGSAYLGDFVVFPVLDNKGLQVAYVSIQRDITQLKREQKLVEKERQRLFSVLDEIPTLVYLQAPDHSIRFANRFFRERFGIPGQDQPCYQVLARRTEPCATCPTFTVFETGCALEWEWTDHDGHIFQIYNYPFFDTDNALLVLVLGIDITARKQAEESLRVNEEKYRHLFKHAPAGIYEIDFVKQKFVTANDILLEYLGYSEQEFLALNPFDLLSPQSQREFGERLRLLMAGEPIPDHTELEIIAKNGKRFWALINANYKFKNGKPVGATVVAHDITARKLMEQKLLDQKLRLQEQLLFANALNQIAETILVNEDTNTILTHMTNIIGRTLGVDRSLIYDIDFNHYHLKGLTEWLNPDSPGVTPTKNTYSMDLFIDGCTFMLKHREWVQSHYDDYNPLLVNDGSGDLLHQGMNIKSGFWYPFAFRNRAYYCLVFNQVTYRRHWRQEEINFIKAAAKQVEIAIQKINIQNQKATAEKALLENEKRLRIITDNMMDMLCLTDENLVIKYAGPSCKQVVGYAPEYLIGKKIYDFIYPADMRTVKAAAKRTAESKSTGKVVCRCRHSHGHYIWMETSASCLFNSRGDITGAVFCCRDITDRKKAEEALKESELLYRTIFENKGTAMIIFEQSGIITLVNSEFEKLFGYQREQVEGKKTWQELFVLEDLQIIMQQHAAKKISHGKMPNRYEVHIKDSAGNIKEVLMIVTCFKETGTHVVSMLDITEIKKFQVEMNRLERLHLIGQMAAGIGHEIRNPMTTVRGFLQMFNRKKVYEQHKAHFNLMIEELDRANSIISQFLSLAKNKPLKKDMRSLNSIIETLFPLIQADAFKHDADIKLELNEIPDLLMDEKEIRQLILNLTRNGLEAMPAGGNLVIKTYAENNEVVLAVQDQGVGITAEVLDKIGTPFFTTKDSGTGLGLAVCYNVAAMHNATISVETSKAGTTFYIRFATSPPGTGIYQDPELTNPIHHLD